MILPVSDFKNALLLFLNQQTIPSTTRNTLFSFVFKIDGVNFDNLIDTAINQSDKAFYFSRPQEELKLFALYESFSLKSSGNNHFTSLKDKISDVSDNQVHNFTPHQLEKIPLCFGGTKFCPGSQADEWEDFEDNDWFIPRLLFYSKKGTQYIIAHIYSENNDPPQNESGRIINLLEQLQHPVELTNTTLPDITIKTVEEEEEKWNSLVSKTLLRIAEGSFGKVVLSRRITASLKEFPSFAQIIIKLQNNYNNCTTFLYSSKESVLFGATPEQLLKFRNNNVEFDALAGSAKRGSNDKEDEEISSRLLNDRKNIVEHNHVIDFIKNTASEYVSHLKQLETGIKKFSNIQHIYTPLKAELKSKDKLYNLVEDIFPTPAICGYPKEASFKYIIENENFNRGMFSGIVGFFNPDEMDLVIAIRSALLRHNVLYLYAGCGIVSQSDPKSEFDETEIKMKPILSLFINENK